MMKIRVFLGGCSTGPWKLCFLYWVECSIYDDEFLLHCIFRSVSLQLFSLLLLSVVESGNLKSPTRIVECSVSPFSSNSFAFCILRFCCLVAYQPMPTILGLSWWFDSFIIIQCPSLVIFFALKFTLSAINIAISFKKLISLVCLFLSLYFQLICVFVFEMSFLLITYGWIIIFIQFLPFSWYIWHIYI